MFESWALVAVSMNAVIVVVPVIRCRASPCRGRAWRNSRVAADDGGRGGAQFPSRSCRLKRLPTRVPELATGLRIEGALGDTPTFFNAIEHGGELCT